MCKKVDILFIIIIAVIPLYVEEEVDMVGLIPAAQWHLNDIAGVGANSVVDSSGNAIHGTPNNMENADEDQVNMHIGAACLRFDATDEYVDFGANFAYDKEDSFTIEGWMKGAEATDSMYWAKWTLATGKGWFFAVKGDGSVVFSLTNTATTNTINIQVDPRLTINTWHHFGVTYNGNEDASGVKIYVDGVLKINSVNFNNLTASILVADNAQLVCETATARTDEWAIYASVLSEEDMKFRFNAGVGVENMDTLVWDISALDNIIKFEVNDMTLDEGIPYAILEVVDSVVPADWYISFTGNYRFSAVTADEQFFKGIVDTSKTKRDDKTGIRTFTLDHWLKSDFKHKPDATFGVPTDTWEDVLEDIIAADLSNLIDGGHIAGNVTTDARTFTKTRTFLSIIREACVADGHIPYIEANTSELFKDDATTTQNLTWTDTTGASNGKGCKWMGSKPQGFRYNQVNVKGIGITSQKNATDTTFQTKYGVIPITVFKAESDQTYLDLWAQQYIDNIAAESYIIFLQLYTGYHLAPGQTVLYSSEQMVVNQDTYLIKRVRYDALTGEILKVKLSLGLGFRAKSNIVEQINENTEFTEAVRVDLNSQNSFNIPWMKNTSGALPSNYTVHPLNYFPSADNNALIYFTTHQKAGVGDIVNGVIVIAYSVDTDINYTMETKLEASADDESATGAGNLYNASNTWNASAIDTVDFKELTFTGTISAEDVVSVRLSKTAGAGNLFIHTILVKPA